MTELMIGLASRLAVPPFLPAIIFYFVLKVRAVR
jgi:hypothetical protein